jgi:hypothetical protein
MAKSLFERVTEAVRRHTVADAVVMSMQRHKRKAADLYPTPAEGTVAILPWLLEKLKPGSRIAEPACGRGDMALVLEYAGFKVMASDIQLTGFGKPFVNFLKVNPKLDRFSADGLVTNPPFDQAEEFIRHAVQRLNVPVVAMILKSNYWHAKRGLKLWDECTPTGHFPMTWRLAFLEEERGKSPLMDCSWFVWCQGDPPMKDRPLEKPSVVPQLSYPLGVHIMDNVRARLEMQAALEAWQRA